MIPDWLRREFRIKNFYFEHSNERVLYGCLWKWPPLVYIFVRALLSGYSIYALFHHLLDSRHTREPSIVYFSAWAYLLLVIHLVSSTFISFYFHRHDDEGIVQLELPAAWRNTALNHSQRQHSASQDIPNDQSKESFKNRNDSTSEAMVKDELTSRVISPEHVEHANESSDCVPGAALAESKEEQERSDRLKELEELHSTYESFGSFHRMSIEAAATRWYLQASWCLANIVSASAPVATVLFFSDLYPRSIDGLDLPNVNVQVLNIAFVIVDHMISARPVRLLHAIAPIAFGLIYIIFSLIYWSTSKLNPVTYDAILDWASPGGPVGFILGLSVVVFPAIQITFFGIHHIKKLIHVKLYGIAFDEYTY